MPDKSPGAHVMKKLIFALVCAAALSSCGKKDEPQPVPVKVGIMPPNAVKHV